jgi:hypothetical protein
VAHALINDEFALFHPYSAGDPSGETTRLRALAAVWHVYRELGIDRLVLSRVVETDEAVEAIGAALDADEVQVISLVAPLSVINKRIEGRSVPTAAQWCRTRAADLVDLWRVQPLSGMTVEASGRSATETADEIVRLSGWNDPSDRFVKPP